MDNKLSEFRELSWGSNPFKLMEKSDSNIRIMFENLSMPDKSCEIKEIEFKNPRNEWASLWNAELNEWQEHPDIKSPIGDEIIDAYVKPVGSMFKFSFAGNHKLGWARWGFASESFKIITK